MGRRRRSRRAGPAPAEAAVTHEVSRSIGRWPRLAPGCLVEGAEPSYDRRVTEQARAVLATALRLSVKDRAELAAEVLASLDGEPDEDVEVAWTAEIERRVRRLEREGSRGRPWREVFDGFSRQP